MKYLLGIEAASSDKGIYLNQRKYTLALITDLGFVDAKPSLVLMKQNHTLLSDTASPFINNITRYKQLVGHLIYLTIT